MESFNIVVTLLDGRKMTVGMWAEDLEEAKAKTIALYDQTVAKVEEEKPR